MHFSIKKQQHSLISAQMVTLGPNWKKYKFSFMHAIHMDIQCFFGLKFVSTFNTLLLDYIPLMCFIFYILGSFDIKSSFISLQKSDPLREYQGMFFEKICIFITFN